MNTHLHRAVAPLLTLCLLLAAVPALGAQGKVNVNSAEAAELSLLPRVGPAIAGRILEFRKENGPFKTLEDLMLVRGIGEKTFALMKPYVQLSGETTLSEKVSASKAAAATEGSSNDDSEKNGSGKSSSEKSGSESR